MKIAIVKSNFYSDLSANLLKGAKEEFIKQGGSDENIKIFDVPGAFEVPSAVSKILVDSSLKFDALVTLGVLVKGETDHYEHISRSVTDRISELSVDSSIPIVYGILTAQNMEQARDRCDLK
jgi:6,7-dimethyl-8-ribityllumazine synthase